MEEKIEERIRFHNSWWQTGQISSALSPTRYRTIWPTLTNYLSLDRIIILKGPRRTGKSTLMYQLMNYLFSKEHVPISRLVYLNFDDPVLRVDLVDLIKIVEQIHNFSINGSEATYFFLDEVHSLPNWASLTKMLFDKKLPIKIIISDSSASLLACQSESLGGRTIEETILPLSFTEWLTFNLPTSTSSLNTSMALSFGQYLNHSGFMHLLDIKDATIRAKMLVEDVVVKAIYKDTVDIFGLREPAMLERMFSYLVATSAGLINITKLATMLGIDRMQTNKYIKFLEDTYLIFPLQKFSQMMRESLRSQPKVHVIDQGFGQVFNTSKDAIYESIVARHIWERWPRKTYFWRDRTEVDVVIDTQRRLIPIEVKNTTRVDQSDLAGLFAFTAKYHAKTGYVVYNGSKKSEKYNQLTIHYVPVWEFLTEGINNLDN